LFGQNVACTVLKLSRGEAGKLFKATLKGSERIKAAIKSYSSYGELVLRRTQFLQQAKQKNFGFPEIRILNGGIGYIRITQFYDTNDQSLEVVNNAFSFLKNVSALIMDVRDNPGGEPEMVRYINSYFFNGRVHLNDFYDRQAVTNQYWTEPLPVSVTFSTMPVYVLTNGHTGSAAEEFAYDLQSLHRAIIIGQTSAGAAHWTTANSISNGFVGNIPFRKAVNPVTHTNWEKVGVKPEISCTDSKAPDVALLAAYNHLITISTDSILIKSLKWQRVAVNAKLHPFKINLISLKLFTGVYNGRHITFTKGVLYFNDTNGYHIDLIPISADVFIFSNNDRRLEFERDDNGRIIGFDFIYPGGKAEKFSR